MLPFLTASKFLLIRPRLVDASWQPSTSSRDQAQAGKLCYMHTPSGAFERSAVRVLERARERRQTIVGE